MKEQVITNELFREIIIVNDQCIGILDNQLNFAYNFRNQIVTVVFLFQPHVLVWDLCTLETLMSFGQGIFERGLCAVEFSTFVSKNK